MHSVYQSGIIDLRNVVVTRNSYEDAIKNYDPMWRLLAETVEKKGSLWILGRNMFDQELLPFPLDITRRVQTLTDFKLRNVWIVYRESSNNSSKPLASAHYLIPFLVKTPNDYRFYKDSVREPHIFKDIEWGKRTVGKSGYSDEEKPRYSPKGRDPGNVFYRTLRNGDGYVIAVNEYADEEIYEKIVKISTTRNGTVASNISDESFGRLVEGLGRKLKILETAQ